MKKQDIIEKTQKTVSFQNIIIQFVIITFFTIIWLNAPIFGVGALNVQYFLFMFIASVASSIVTLWSKANPDVPIPKKPTQQFSNLIKAIVDSITNIMNKETPAVKEITNMIQKAVIWSLREAKISPEFDRKTLELAEDYFFNKLFPKEGEKSSQTNGEKI